MASLLGIQGHSPSARPRYFDVGTGTHPGGHALPDGTLPIPGGWNRILIQVADLDAAIETLRSAGIHFRDDQPSGVAVRQVLLEDPSGNPIELFEPARGYHERRTSV